MDPWTAYDLLEQSRAAIQRVFDEGEDLTPEHRASLFSVNIVLQNAQGELDKLAWRQSKPAVNLAEMVV